MVCALCTVCHGLFTLSYCVIAWLVLDISCNMFCVCSLLSRAILLEYIIIIIIIIIIISFEHCTFLKPYVLCEKHIQDHFKNAFMNIKITALRTRILPHNWTFVIVVFSGYLHVYCLGIKQPI